MTDSSTSVNTLTPARNTFNPAGNTFTPAGNAFNPARNARRRCRTWVIAGLAGVAVALSMLGSGVQGVAQADDANPDTTTIATVRNVASDPAG